MMTLHEILGCAEDGPGGCALWVGPTKNGYAVRGRTYLHRVVCVAHNGPPPSVRHEAMHSCDVKRCVAPQHLSWGTRKKNANDAFERGLCERVVAPKGEAHHSHKLTEADVIAIRLDTRSGRVVGAEYGVSSAAINMVRSRKTWRHVP